MTNIAICAPATPITVEQRDALLALVAAEFPGHRVTFHDQCFERAGHFAGDDLRRLTALLECANDPAFDVVWFAKGGYGSNRIAEAAVARMNAPARTKTYIGFSDCGYLLAALYKARIGQSVHGHMPVSARSDGGKEAIRRVLRWLEGDTSGVEPSLDGATPAAAFNLITLAMLTGTQMMPDLTGHVVMVEEVAEHMYSVDRLFFHLAGTLPRIAGLRLGAITDVPENYVEFGQGEEDIARFWCARAGIPYLGRALIGHYSANRVVPFGLASPPSRT
jgi:muramoyltetrapeptide carboxypeptidase